MTTALNGKNRAAVIDVGLDEETYITHRNHTRFSEVCEGTVCHFDDFFIMLRHDEYGRSSVDDLITALKWICESSEISSTSAATAFFAGLIVKEAKNNKNEPSRVDAWLFRSGIIMP